MPDRKMLSEVFYRKCTACRSDTAEGALLCEDCELEIFPHSVVCLSCGAPAVVETSRCGACLSKPPYRRITVDYEYKGAVKQLIKNIKFRWALGGLSSLNSLIRADFAGADFDIIVPVPSHFTRSLTRFRHPANILAGSLAERYGKKYAKLLKRKKITKYQWQLNKKQRAANVKGAFTVNSDVLGLKILLVDDIITTSSTVTECAHTLLSSGADRVDVYALCGGVNIR